MVRLILKRILQAIPMLVAVSIISFMLIQIAPGDPVSAYITPESQPADIELMREKMGLNDSIITQYLRWSSSLLRGDWGYSYSNHRPVAEQIVERVPATLMLMGSALLVSIVSGAFLGVLSAIKPGGWIDRLVSLGSNIAISIPGFWLAMVLLYLFSLKLGWLPSIGMRSIGVNTTTDLLKHMIMPVIVLSFQDTAIISRYVRSRVMEELKEDYVLTEIAYGAKKSDIYFRSVLRNSLLPLITIVGMSLPRLLSGAFITESIFGWPGLGQLGINAVLRYDYSMIMATTLIASGLVILGSLLADILYGVIDPRIQGLD